MKALIYDKNSNPKIALKEKTKPEIISDTDAIIKVTLSSICTSDLHIIDGFVPNAKNNIVLGHEFVGIIEKTGKNVKNFKKGDRVSVNCETFCKDCFFCKNGFINNCINGGWNLGCTIDGCQAECVRVPWADNVLTKINDNITDKNALFVGDILSSGYFGAKMCEIEPNDTVAIIGSGPVGMCAMISAKILKAKTIIAIDINQNRLNIAKKQNLADFYLNPNDCNIENEIKKITKYGIDKVIEAAGGNNTFEMAWKIARPNGIIGIVAMYEKNQILPLPIMYGKNLTFKTGGVDAIYCRKLMDLISKNKINTDFLITHSFKFKNIIEAYSFFKSNKDDCLKVMIEY